MNSYARLAAFLFAIIAVLQFIRAVGGWGIVINGTVSVPVWASWVACIVFAGLALIGLSASRPKELGDEEWKEFRKRQRKEFRERQREESEFTSSDSEKEERKRRRKQEREERRRRF